MANPGRLNPQLLKIRIGDTRDSCPDWLADSRSFVPATVTFASLSGTCFTQMTIRTSARPSPGPLSRAHAGDDHSYG